MAIIQDTTQKFNAESDSAPVSSVLQEEEQQRRTQIEKIIGRLGELYGLDDRAYQLLSEMCHKERKGGYKHVELLLEALNNLRCDKAAASDKVMPAQALEMEYLLIRDKLFQQMPARQAQYAAYDKESRRAYMTARWENAGVCQAMSKARMAAVNRCERGNRLRSLTSACMQVGCMILLTVMPYGSIVKGHVGKQTPNTQLKMQKSMER